MTAPERRVTTRPEDADSLRLCASCWEAQAQTFEAADLPDGAERIVLLLREAAREAVWTAAQLSLIAALQEPCHKDEDVPEIGRTEEWPQSLTIVRGGAA